MRESEKAAQAWLNRSFEDYRYLLYLGERLERFEAKANKSVNSSMMREIVGGSDANSIETSFIELAELKKTVEEKRDELQKADAVTFAMINKLDDALKVSILTLRYIKRLSWRDIEKIIHYSHAYTMEVHVKALADIYEIMPKE